MNMKPYLILIAFFLVGCLTIQQQQRPDSKLCSEKFVTESKCSSSSFISLDVDGGAEKPILAFIEFNNEGVPFDQENIDKCLGKIASLSDDSDKNLLMVAFIHGWHHNAAQTDTNVIQFKNFLLALQREEQSLRVGTKRSVVGIYLGWQGKKSENELVNLLSYRDKKELGLSTGKKSVAKVLERLSEIRASNKNNRLILVGHSFGGGVLYSAIRKELLDNLNNPIPRSTKLFGDLVVLLNPAVEAGRFVDVHEHLNNHFDACTPLAMVSFTSESDTALSKEFPKGMRLFYRDQLRGGASDELLTNAYGNYSDFSKYHLTLDPGAVVEDTLTKPVFNTAALSWASFRDGNTPFTLGPIVLKKKESSVQQNQWEPVLNVLVDKTLIAEHNDIWDPKFTYFLRGLVGMEFAKALRCR